jgi:hypothetical protein
VKAIKRQNLQRVKLHKANQLGRISFLAFMASLQSEFYHFGILVIKCQLFACSYGLLVHHILKYQLKNVRT